PIALTEGIECAKRGNVARPGRTGQSSRRPTQSILAGTSGAGKSALRHRRRRTPWRIADKEKKTMSATPVTISHLTPEQQAVVMGQKAFLANITEQTWMAHRTYGTFQIPGRKAEEKYSLTEISPRTGSIDLGDKRKLDFPISA